MTRKLSINRADVTVCAKKALAAMVSQHTEDEGVDKVADQEIIMKGTNEVIYCSASQVRRRKHQSDKW